MNTKNSYLKVLLSACLTAGLMACTTTPRVVDDLEQDSNGLFIRKVEITTQTQKTALEYKKVMAQQHSLVPSIDNLHDVILSPGDTLRLSFAGMPKLDGLYQINALGKLEVPFSETIKAAGKTRSQLIATVKQEMITSQWFYADTSYIDVSVVRLAPIHVAVLGAVFNPGRVLIDTKPANKADELIQNQGGAFSQGRDLIAALSASGGIRPDADLHAVFLKRDGQVYPLDLAPIISGMQFTPTPTLNSGDVIFVSSTGVERQQLIRPSQITPPGMRVFMSNLTAPALSNAQSAVGADATRLPYGSSLLDSAISANCVGGTQMANASRSIVLITRNHGSNKQLVIKRSINELLANSSHSTINPFLMPNDGVACYDSKFTNFRDVARGIGEVISPIIFGGLL